MNQRALILLVLAGASICAAVPAHAVECFSIYDARNALVYQTSTSPIDLSRSIGDQMARRFPSSYLVIADASPCVAVGRAAMDPTSGPASLLSSRDGNGPVDSDYTADPYSPPAAAPAVPARGRGTTRAAAARR